MNRYIPKSNEDLGNCPHLTKQPAVQMLKCNWSTIVFENHGGSFSSILRQLPSRAGSFAGPAMTDNNHYWRWSKRLTGPLLPYYHSIYAYLPSGRKFLEISPLKSGWREGLCWVFFLLHFPFFVWFLTAIWKWQNPTDRQWKIRVCITNKKWEY